MLRRLGDEILNRNLRPSVILNFLAVALISLSAKAQAPAQDSALPLQTPPGPSATLSIAAREVLLDVVVTGRNGQPVTGLTPADFTIVEEGESQRLAHLEEHHGMSAEDVAWHILRAIEKGYNETCLTLQGKLMVLVNRFSM